MRSAKRTAKKPAKKTAKKTARTVLRLAIGTLAVLVAMGALGVPAQATWADDNCSGKSWDVAVWKRSQAHDYAIQADKEGYEFGGGCYKLNDRDDTPNLDVNAGGEGADCSGFTFKVWALRADGAPGFRFWEHERQVHGPYSTALYYSPPSTAQFKSIAKTYGATLFMDALATRQTDWGHVALIEAEGIDGWDYVIHARNDDVGTLLQAIDYRSQSIYKAVARKGWTPECYPRCL